MNRKTVGKCAHVITCAAWGGLFVLVSAVELHAGAPIPYTNEASLRGVVYETGYGLGWDVFGSGLAFVDLDNDGDSDLVAAGDPGGNMGIWENDGTGNFTAKMSVADFPIMLDSSAVTAADYDADGDLDLYFTVWLAPNKLFRNDGNFEFTDVTAAAGVGDAGAGCGMAWGDYNGDGWLDLYIANRTGSNMDPTPNRLYHNNGDGTFTDVAGALGVDRGMDPTLNVVWFDYDDDGDDDLYLSTDKGTGLMWQNWLFRNEGGTFTDVSAASGTDIQIDSMGVACGDFDRNGWPDLFCTNIPNGHALLLNNGDGTFARSEVPTGTATYEIGWGACFLDYDNDAWNELYICQMLAVNRMYDHDGVWPAVEIGGALNVAATAADSAFGMAVADIDADGDLDMVVQSLDRFVAMYINHEGSTRNWIRFNVIGKGNNKFAIGAKARVRTGSTWQVAHCAAGHNWKSQNESVMHFGLDTATLADEIEVRWPGGEMRTLTNYPANVRWSLYADERLGDFDGDLDQDLSDFVQFSQAYGASIWPPYEMMDLDGDSDCDIDDFNLFEARYDGPADDCNDNMVLDIRDIITNFSADLNGDGIPDECQVPADCDGDADGNFMVNVNDISYIVFRLGTSGTPGEVEGDVDGNGQVNVNDITYTVFRLGSPCK